MKTGLLCGFCDKRLYSYGRSSSMSHSDSKTESLFTIYLHCKHCKARFKTIVHVKIVREPFQIPEEENETEELFNQTKNQLPLGD